MTDIMAYLAARSLRGDRSARADDGTTMPLLRPRLPSRYEPQEPGQATDVVHEDTSLDVAPPPRRADQSRDDAASHARRASSESQSPPPVTTPQHAETPSRNTSSPSADPSHPSTDGQRDPQLVMPPPAPMAADERTDAASPTEPPQPVRTQTSPPARERVPSDAVPQRERRAPISPEAGDATRQTQDRATADRAARQEPPALPPPRLPVTAPLPENPALRVVPAPLRPAGAADARRRPREEIAAKTSEPPRVQVTIGRIEIRAVSAPPPPQPRPAPRAPSMSLDEYLANRDKG
jgi:hypothetical protein